MPKDKLFAGLTQSPRSVLPHPKPPHLSLATTTTIGDDQEDLRVEKRDGAEAWSEEDISEGLERERGEEREGLVF